MKKQKGLKDKILITLLVTLDWPHIIISTRNDEYLTISYLIYF